MEHRGRIQAQGENQESSEAWAQNKPPTKNEGLKMLEKLKNKISKNEAKIREHAFKKAARFINNGRYKIAGRMISKTFMVANSQHERVDIEIRKGTAFTVDKNQLK